MTDCPQRIGLMLILTGLLLLLMLGGRGFSRNEKAVAFFSSEREESHSVTIHFEGDVMIPGVYRFIPGIETRGVINMTVPRLHGYSREIERLFSDIESGTIVSVSVDDGKHVEISTKSMGIEEKVLLGIPLNINSMSVNDWEKLPGIGRATARRIVAYRQKYGEFSSGKDLLKVNGIGKAKLRAFEDLLIHANCKKY